MYNIKKKLYTLLHAAPAYNNIIPPHLSAVVFFSISTSNSRINRSLSRYFGKRNKNRFFRVLLRSIWTDVDRGMAVRSFNLTVMIDVCKRVHHVVLYTATQTQSWPLTTYTYVSMYIGITHIHTHVYINTHYIILARTVEMFAVETDGFFGYGTQYICQRTNYILERILHQSPIVIII